MKKKIIYLIKHNNFIKLMFVLSGSLFFKFLGLFIKMDDSLVLLVSNNGNSISGSPKAIYQYTKNNKIYNGLHYIWAVNDPEKFKNEDFDVVKFDSFKYFVVALRAKYWITDINIERSLKFKKKRTKYLNSWHGVALKHIGNDDKYSGRYDYSNIDYLCVSGKHDKDVYKSALNATESSFLETGMPRNDDLVDVTANKIIDVRIKLNLPSDKKIILYAPTWRDSSNGGKSYDLNIPIDFKKWENELKNEYLILIRAHDRTTKMLNIEYNEFIRDYSKYEPLNDLLIVADVLITDYSSIVFDYTLMKKPFISYCYDYEQYKTERGFYFDPEQVYPGGILKTENEVLSRLKSHSFNQSEDDYNKMNSMFMNYTKGNATKACAEKLFGK